MQRTVTRQRSEEHTSELQSHLNLVCRLLLEKKKTQTHTQPPPPTRTHIPDTTPTTTQTHTNTQTHTHTHPQERLALLTHLSFFFNYSAPPQIHPLSPPHASPN